LGGDEFVILLSERQEENNAFVIIERIRKQISNTVFDSGTYKFNASCSFGIVTLEPEQLTITDLANQMLSCADEALYNAKHEGKNKIGVATLPQLEL
jgi:diguanylate cyclase (GGDEF)-like protein